MLFFSRRRPKALNLMLIGASGGVANAFLHHLTDYRRLFRKLVLVDKRDTLLRDDYIDHKMLDYHFLHKEISVGERKEEYLALLRDHEIDVVLDLTDMESIPILEATDAAGVSYINTAMNDDVKSVKDLIFDIYPRKAGFKGAAHILCAGMNPGNVNMWVRYGVEKYGVPTQITHFELDTSKVAKQWHPMMTWSIHEFIVEAVRDPTGVALGRGNVKTLLPNALENRESMRHVLAPIMKLERYPEGMVVLHEENVSLSYKYDIPSKFLYSIHPQTMRRLIQVYEKKGNVTKKSLELGDNVREILDGADNIGVALEYPDKRVYYFNSVPNVAVIGTNATYTQVIVGIFAALFCFVYDKLPRGAYFVEDLFDTHYKYFMFDNMRVQEYVFRKDGGALKLQSYNPMVKLKRDHHLEHHYII